jgi:hypothetical protein
MKISVVCPVLNENPWIGYSIMAALPYVHEFIYALDEKSDDGTRELLHHVKEKYARDRLVIIDHPTFHPSDMRLYNGAFNTCISKMTGEAAWFLHPDMIVTDAKMANRSSDPYDRETHLPNATAWYTTMTSYAGDFETVISKGRTDKWKNIHRKTMGLCYFGGYGSQNEDFYHSDITGKSYKHYGSEFSKYPYQVADSGIKINHYCELKDYKRRLEKMKTCMKTLYPTFSEERITELATQHPRVTLEDSSKQFGAFEFAPSKEPIPEVFTKYKTEFESFKKELIHG